MLFLALFCLSAICAVQSADMTIKCFTGTVVYQGGHEQKILQEEACENGVTQCLKNKGGLNVRNVKGGTYLYSCGDKKVQAEGCVKEEKNIAGLVTQKTERCVCTGNLCNSASNQGINFYMALSCFLIAYFRLFV